jgi:hypothetical protein
MIWVFCFQLCSVQFLLGLFSLLSLFGLFLFPFVDLIPSSHAYAPPTYGFGPPTPFHNPYGPRGGVGPINLNMGMQPPQYQGGPVPNTNSMNMAPPMMMGMPQNQPPYSHGPLIPMQNDYPPQHYGGDVRRGATSPRDDGGEIYQPDSPTVESHHQPYRGGGGGPMEMRGPPTPYPVGGVPNMTNFNNGYGSSQYNRDRPLFPMQGNFDLFLLLLLLLFLLLLV